MFWYPLLETAQKIAQESGLTYRPFALAMNDVLDRSLPFSGDPRKRLTTLTRDIWQLQFAYVPTSGAARLETAGAS